MRLQIILLLLFMYSVGFGQTNYSGHVVDAITNLPIESVNVILKGEAKGTSTNIDGKFTIQLTKQSSTILFSHVGYETESYDLKQGIPADQIYLLPKTNLIDEIIVSSKSQIDSLSSIEECSILDFEMLDELLYKLEYHGSFESSELSIATLSGELITSIKLKKIKQVQSLFKSCNNTIYVVTANSVYPVRYENSKLVLDNRVPIETFEKFVRPCQLKKKDALYYLHQKDNGLVSTIYKFNKNSSQSEIIRIIASEAQLENYQADLDLIHTCHDITNITTTDCRENERIRNIQEEGDFLETIFYKPEYPIYIYKKDEQLVLLNHIENKIEIFQNDQFLNIAETQYLNDRNWLKKIVIDKYTEKAYGIFNYKSGIGVKEIDIETGATNFVGLLDIPLAGQNHIKVYNNTIYYLSESVHNNGAKVLLSQRI